MEFGHDDVHHRILPWSTPSQSCSSPPLSLLCALLQVKLSPSVTIPLWTSPSSQGKIPRLLGLGGYVTYREPPQPPLKLTYLFTCLSSHSQVLNDPVMGGLSTGSFNTDSNAGVGSFNGHVAIVPKLSAPGKHTNQGNTRCNYRLCTHIPYVSFCVFFPCLTLGFSTLETTNGLGVFGYANDASGYTHLLITVKNHVAYNGWKVSVAADTINPQFKVKTEIVFPPHL